jgi:hypothetical protein
MKLTLEKGYKFPGGVWFPPEERKRAARHAAWLELVKLCCEFGTIWDATDAESAAERMAGLVVEHSTDLRRLLRADPCEGGGEGDES